MFCRLNRAKIATALDLTEFETCEESCDYFKDNSCVVSQDETICLSKERFGWRLDLKINFIEPISSKSENTYYCNLIQLIHPTYSDVWVVKALKKDKETETFLIYQDGKHMDTFASMETLNDGLKIKYHYNGREFNDNDFMMGDQ